VEIGQDVEADAVLADVPCSELGTLRRGPDLRFRLREETRSACRRCSGTCWKRRWVASVRSRLVYATCTIRSEENEEVALALERAHPELRRLPPDLPSELVRDGFSGPGPLARHGWVLRSCLE